MSATDLDIAREAQEAGRWDEALGYFEASFSEAARAGDVGKVAEVLRWIGKLHTERGDLELASDLFEASLAVAEANGLPEKMAFALICMATNEQRCGRFAEAEVLYRRARDIPEAVGNERIAAMIEQNIGTIANVRGDPETALECYRFALECYQRLGDDHSASRALHNMGMAYVDLEAWAEAEESFSRAFVLADQLRDLNAVATIEVNRAELYLKSGAFLQARDCCDRAFELFGRIGSEAGLAEVHKHFGTLYRQTYKPVLAHSQLESAVRIASRCGDRLLRAEALSEWALVHLGEERNREALQCLNDAHRLFSELSASRELLDLDRRLDGLESTYLKVVQAWGESIESKDRYTAGHCERVANYACMLAQAVGITGRDLTWLRMGGYLHDVGKIAVPAEVLNKPGKLTDEEFRLMQDHTVEGDAIVSELNFPWDIRPAVRWHHERWDGSGYPDGLKGEEIPLTARILCVADVYDALTTTRSYRPAMSRDEALEIMLRDVGRFFDPQLFPIFRVLIARASPMPDRRFPAFGGSAVVAA